jgi:hypothetical protein
MRLVTKLVHFDSVVNLHLGAFEVNAEYCRDKMMPMLGDNSVLKTAVNQCIMSRNDNLVRDFDYNAASACDHSISI